MHKIQEVIIRAKSGEFGEIPFQFMLNFQLAKIFPPNSKRKKGKIKMMLSGDLPFSSLEV